MDGGDEPAESHCTLSVTRQWSLPQASSARLAPRHSREILDEGSASLPKSPHHTPMGPVL
jgi:hypothetical protein